LEKKIRATHLYFLPQYNPYILLKSFCCKNPQNLTFLRVILKMYKLPFLTPWKFPLGKKIGN